MDKNNAVKANGSSRLRCFVHRHLDRARNQHVSNRRRVGGGRSRHPDGLPAWSSRAASPSSAARLLSLLRLAARCCWLRPVARRRPYFSELVRSPKRSMSCATWVGLRPPVWPRRSESDFARYANGASSLSHCSALRNSPRSACARAGWPEPMGWLQPSSWGGCNPCGGRAPMGGRNRTWVVATHRVTAVHGVAAAHGVAAQPMGWPQPKPRSP